MKEIVIVTQTRPGLVADITSALAERGINLDTLNAEEVQDAVVVEMTVDRYNDALLALRDSGFEAVTEDALLIRLRDEPGALARVARRFQEAAIPLRSIRFVRRQQGWAFVALATPRTDEARAIVQDLVVRD